MNIVSVSELNNYIKQLIGGSNFLSNLTVRAEISNFTNHVRTGHFYLTLKDEKSIIRAVMFSEKAKKLKFMPENGMGVIVSGKVAVFPRDGQYQFYIDDMQPDGVGALQVAFEQLRQKLSDEGLFDERRKKPIPAMPMRIGVITSPTGAAVRDIINVLGRRFPLSKVLLCPVLVQGPGAAPQLVKAVSMFNKRELADLLIIGRGGGSIEELWAFNEEAVARAVADSVIPVISAVGHETDFTICDFAADLRAPTPSAAAELAVPSAAEHKSRLRGGYDRLCAALCNYVEKKRIEASAFKNSRFFKNPALLTDDGRMLAAHIVKNILSAQKLLIAKRGADFSKKAAKLDSLSPLTTLSRGYIYGQRNGNAIKSVKDIAPGDEITLRMSDGAAKCEVTALMPQN